MSQPARTSQRTDTPIHDHPAPPAWKHPSIRLRRPPVTARARCWLRRRRRRRPASSRSFPMRFCPTAGSVLSGMAPDPGARFRPGSELSQCSARRCATGRRACRTRKRSVHPEHSAAMGAAVTQSRCVAPGALSARRFHRRFLGGAERAHQTGCAEPVTGRHLAAHGGLATPRSLGPPLRPYLGRWRLAAGADEASG